MALLNYPLILLKCTHHNPQLLSPLLLLSKLELQLLHFLCHAISPLPGSPGLLVRGLHSVSYLLEDALDVLLALGAGAHFFFGGF